MKIEANQLKNVDVRFISLVERGANRSPFKIFKTDNKENGVIDLSNLFRKKKSDAPEISAIVISKSAASDETVARLKDAGFDVAESDDESVVLKREDYSEDAAVVAVSENCAVVLDTVKKAFYDYPDTTDFGKNMAKANFFPSYEMAEDTLDETIKNILYGQDVAPNEKAAAIGAAIDDFKAYVMAMAEGLPPSAFELAQYVLVEPASEPVAKSEPSKPKGDGSPEEQPKPIDVSVFVTKNDAEASTAEMSERIKKLEQELSVSRETSAELDARLKKAEVTAENALRAYENIVLGDAIADAEQVHAKKRDNSVFSGTALDVFDK